MKSPAFSEVTSRSIAPLDPDPIAPLFDRIAPRYDRLNDLLSFGVHRLWKRRLISALGPRPGLKVLDAATGTGDLALALSRRGHEVTGLDLSTGMLEIAQRRSTGASAAPQWVLGDVHALPFDGPQFDAVVVSFGVRNFRDPVAGIRELWRVVRPGGTLLILEFGGWRLRPIFRRALTAASRLWGADANAYGYLVRSSSEFPAAGPFVARYLSDLPDAALMRYRRHFFGITHEYRVTKSGA